MTDEPRQPKPRPTSGTLPPTRSCFVCGRENPRGLHLLSRIEGEAVVLDYTTGETDLGYRHIVHGGLAVTLLDEVMTWAAIIASRRVCVAAELTARLREPIGLGQRLRAEGRVTRCAGRLVLAEGRLTDGAGRAFVTALGKYMPMPEDQAQLTEKDFVIGPDTLHPGDLVG